MQVFVCASDRTRIHPNFGGVPVARDARWPFLGTVCEQEGRQIIFEVLQPMWSRYLNVIDGRTDDILSPA